MVYSPPRPQPLLLKKIVAILFLAIIFINQLGYYFLHNIQQYQLKREIKRAMLSAIPESALELITETDQAVWEEEGKEFHLNGEMYDVVKIKTHNGKTVYYCINDKKEKRLLDRLIKLVNANDDSQRGRSGKMTVKFQLCDYEMPGVENTPIVFENRPQYTGFISRLICTEREILSPPPRS